MTKESDTFRMFKDEHEVKIKALFEEYYEHLCLYAEGIVKNHQVAEEIVEDLFVHLWLHSDSLKINHSYKAYLFRSTHNNCIKYLMHQKKNQAVFCRHSSIDEETLLPESKEVPVSLLITKEIEEKTEAILSKLPRQCKDIYFLNCYENMSYSEIAKKLNINVSTVKTQMSRAFKKLHDGLKDFI